MTSNNCDPVEQQLRQERLDALYEADGRHDPKHPMHALYTGLLIDKKEEANAALAHPESQGPTASDVTELFYRHMGEGSEVGFENAIVEALTRWGRPAIEPVPVAERLPEPEDCDEEGVCWWWHPDHRDEEFGDGWILLKSEWADGHHDADYSLIYTHWLPHWVLPVPQQEVK